MTVDLVGALVRIARREATAEDLATAVAAVAAVAEAERLRIEQDPAAHEDDHPVARSFADGYLRLGFAAESILRSAEAGRAIRASEVACVLLAGHTLSPVDLAPLLPVVREADAGKVRRQSARIWAELGDLERAAAEAEAMDHLTYIGYREIGDVYAARGDAAGFFRHWKTYAASKDRNDMSRRKERLVSAVARHHGWQAALKVCDDKRIGPACHMNALGQLSLSDLEQALASLPPGTVSDSDRLFLLVDAVVAESGDAPEADHPRLPSLLDEIIALDPASSRDTMRERNWLLQRLWPAYGDQASIDRAYKAARGPSAKGELGKRLSRDVPGPDQADR